MEEIEKNDGNKQFVPIKQSIYLLWAKSNPFKQLLAHMIDTGCCAQVYLSAESSRAILGFLTAEWHCSDTEALSFVAYLAAMHDIGKAMPQFQKQDEEQYARLLNQGMESLFPPKYTVPIRHEFESARIAKRIWKGNKGSTRLFDSYSSILALHHQRIEMYRSQQSLPEEWIQIQNIIETNIKHVFHFSYQFPTPDCMDAVCVLLSGLIILCDWVASSGPFDGIHIASTLEEYLSSSMEVAKHALQQYGLIGNCDSATVTTFNSVWPNIQSPRDIQVKCSEIEPKAPLTIIEAPMGEGKTEAALFLAERMCKAWNKRGIYVALPTQATSNQMFGRTLDMLNTIHGGRARLLHGTAFLQDYGKQIQSDDAQEAERWFGALRMGLLDENGVGTVDQAMAGVLRARFSILRLLGLTNKVLVIDELHAYDAYMSKIIESLLRWCQVLHIPVILLSATLQSIQRVKYLSCFTNEDITVSLSSSYPLITQVTEEGKITQIKAEATLATEYIFAPLRLGQDSRDIALYAISQVEHGGCYCVLLNTVIQAQEVYRSLLENVDSETETLLFHARFPIWRREEIEKACLKKFGKGSNADRPKKAILVATQVVEQSLDLDFDGMMTELAPIDLLLQRAGRVHRHRNRMRPIGLDKPIVRIILPKENETMDLERRFGKSGIVYAPFLLSNTEHLVENTLRIRVPDEVRSVIAAVYESITPENRAAWEKRAFDHQLMRANACGATFPEPQKDIFFPAESHSEFINLEVDDGFEPASRATTRLGEPTIRISFSTPVLYEAAKAGFLSKEQQRQIFLSSVSLPVRQFSGENLEASTLYKVEKGRLRGCLVSDNCDRIRLGKKVLLNDPNYGVLWKE